MRAIEIDIAVDLGGQLPAAASRRSSLSVRRRFRPRSWAHPATTGADFIDYLIGDATATPPEHQPFFSEQLVRLPDSYFPTDAGLAIGPVPSRAQAGLPQDGFVFCAFNEAAGKITAPVFDIWDAAAGGQCRAASSG